MLMAALLGELPDAPVSNRLLAACEFSERDFEVEMGQQLLFCFRLHGSNLSRGCPYDARHHQRPVDQLIDALGSPRCEQATVAGKEGVGR